MASSVCASCLRTSQRQAALSTTRSISKFSLRAFSTTPLRTSSAEYVSPASKASARAESLTPEPASTSSQSTASTVQQLRKLAGKTTETYTAYGATEILYKECARQADYSIPQAADKEAEMPKTEDGEDLGVGTGWWHTDLGLRPTFSTWSQVTMIHMYLLAARFRCFEGSSVQSWQQHLLDHFFYDAEDKMSVQHNMHARGTRNRYLKDLYIQWRGLLAAYDEGLARGDAILAAAIWRNIFKADPDIDIRALAQITSYVRKNLAELEKMPDNLLMGADVRFQTPRSESGLVDARSPMIDLPFEMAQGAEPSA